MGSFLLWFAVDSYWVVLALIGLRTTQGSDCGFLLGRFGHDRAKNDSGIGFPHPSCESLVLLRVYSGWSSDCVGVGMKVGVCLINLVCLGTTQTELEGWLSSPQPLNSTGREVRS